MLQVIAIIGLIAGPVATAATLARKVWDRGASTFLLR